MTKRLSFPLNNCTWNRIFTSFVRKSQITHRAGCCCLNSWHKHCIRSSSLFRNPAYDCQLPHSVFHCKNIFLNNVPTLSKSCYHWGKAKSNVKEWNKAVSEAEKIVGYPTSFMSLRCLLSDEFSHVAMHMRKLVGTKHPIMKTARGLLHDKKHSLQTRGLIVLLISKAAGIAKDIDKQRGTLMEKEISSGITESQRQLAEIVEMIHTANLIHKGVVNLRDLIPTDDAIEDMELGNKMAVLSGDFLLANASVGLAELHNTQVVEIISSSIGDLMTAEFTGLTDDEGNGKLKSDVKLEDWEKQTFLSSGSLLAKSCRSALLLSDHPECLQDQAFQFGINLAYAQQLMTLHWNELTELVPMKGHKLWLEKKYQNLNIIQADLVNLFDEGLKDSKDQSHQSKELQLNEDMKPFLSQEKHMDQLSLSSAPIVHHIMENGTEGFDTLAGISNDFGKVVTVIKASNALSMCRTLLEAYGEKALHSLEHFADSDAKTGLKNIVQAVIKL